MQEPECLADENVDELFLARVTATVNNNGSGRRSSLVMAVIAMDSERDARAARGASFLVVDSRLQSR